MLLRRVFRVDTRGVWVNREVEDTCGVFKDWVRQHFQLPRNISKVIVSLYLQPSVNREKGTIRICGCTSDCTVRQLVFRNKAFDEPGRRNIFRRFVGHAVYLEIEYE